LTKDQPCINKPGRFPETSRSYSFEMLSPATANVAIHWEKINSAFKVEAEPAKPAASGKQTD